VTALPSCVFYDTTIDDQVARISIVADPSDRFTGPPPDLHYELFEIINHLRTDSSVRVIVIQGEHDGKFYTPDPDDDRPGTDTTEFFKRFSQMSDRVWKAATGIVQLHEVMAEIDRPIVAKVNGDAIGFGASIVFSSDLIVAREDARICDVHLGMGEVHPTPFPHGVVPGDGAGALVPMHMSPARAKEFLMLAREERCSDLAAAGVINYAVPLDELDKLTDSLVERLLRRNAHALAWTKRIANRHVAGHLQKTLDAGVAYELLNMYQLATDSGDRNTLE